MPMSELLRRVVSIAAVAMLLSCGHGIAHAQPPAGSTAAPEIHCKHFIYGYPTGTPVTNDLIIRDSYALSSNDATKFADWVAYRLTQHEVIGTLDLERKWHSDPWLHPTETLQGEKSRDDYGGASNLGYDRGHQAPLASFRGSRHASQTNFMSNITPQKSALNQGPWRILEDRIRNLVKGHYNELWVMTGPLYERDMPALPSADQPHKVPSGYWKIVVVEDDSSAHDIKVAAFIFDQDTPRNDPIAGHVVTVRDVEQRSGLDFLHELPDTAEQQVETQAATAWVTEWR